jgi:hypothetical protein
MERELYFVAAPDFAALPQSFSFPSQHFVALLVADTQQIPDEALGSFARVLLRCGCSYFCVWGPGCERAHDLFDQECLFAPDVIMTTWHHDEPLDDAIWYFLRTTFPDSAFEETTAAALALVVGDSGWAAHVERRLRDIPALADDVLQEV